MTELEPTYSSNGFADSEGQFDARSDLAKQCQPKKNNLTRGNGISGNGSESLNTPDANAEMSIPVLTSKSEVVRFTKEAARRLAADGFPEKGLSRALQCFLLSTFFSRPNLSTVALIDRKEPSFPPILEIYLLWSRAIELSADLPEIQEIEAEHARTFLPFRPRLKSYVDILDPRGISSSEEALTKELSHLSRFAASSRLVGCARLER